MAGYVKVSGAYVQPVSVHARVAGVWQSVQEVYAKVAGTWTKVWEAILASMPDASYSSSAYAHSEDNPFPPPALLRSSGTARLTLKADGTCENKYTQDDGMEVQQTYTVPRSNWLVAGANSNFEVMFTADSSTGISGSTLNTWLALTSDRSLILTATPTVGSTTTRNCTVSIRRTTDNVVQVNSLAFTLSVTMP